MSGEQQNKNPKVPESPGDVKQTSEAPLTPKELELIAQEGQRRAKHFFPALFEREEKKQKLADEKMSAKSMQQQKHPKIGQKPPKVMHPSKLREAKKVKWVLSLDGGGTRGLITAQVLTELQLKLGDQYPITDYFDMVCGTSAGGITALGLTVGELRLHEIVTLFFTLGGTIFRNKSSFWFGFGLFLGLNAQFYSTSTQNLKEVLKKAVGNKFLKPDDRVSQKVFVVGVDQSELRKPKIVLLRNYQHEQSQFESVPGISVADACLATSAAPTYFDPYFVAERQIDGKYFPERKLVDGGTLANDPALIAYAEAVKLWPGYKIRVLSIGTGEAKVGTPGARKEVDQILSYIGGMDLSQRVLRQILKTHADGQSDQLYRLNPLIEKEIPLDSVSEEDAWSMLNSAKGHANTPEFQSAVAAILREQSKPGPKL